MTISISHVRRGSSLLVKREGRKRRREEQGGGLKTRGGKNGKSPETSEHLDITHMKGVTGTLAAGRGGRKDGWMGEKKNERKLESRERRRGMDAVHLRWRCITEAIFR